MAFIIHRMIGKVIYQIKVTTWRDENGKVKSKQVCLGHYDSTGAFVPLRKRLAEQIETKKADITKNEATNEATYDKKELLMTDNLELSQ